MWGLKRLDPFSPYTKWAMLSFWLFKSSPIKITFWKEQKMVNSRMPLGLDMKKRLCAALFLVAATVHAAEFDITKYTSCGPNPDAGCYAPGPCSIEAHQILCWDEWTTTPGHNDQWVELCATQDGVTPLGCWELYQVKFDVQSLDGVDTYHVTLIPRSFAVVKCVDAADHSLVTFNVRFVTDSETNNVSGWVLIDLVPWPEILYYP